MQRQRTSLDNSSTRITQWASDSSHRSPLSSLSASLSFPNFASVPDLSLPSDIIRSSSGDVQLRLPHIPMMPALSWSSEDMQSPFVEWVAYPGQESHLTISEQETAINGWIERLHNPFSTPSKHLEPQSRWIENTSDLSLTLPPEVELAGEHARSRRSVQRPVRYNGSGHMLNAVEEYLQTLPAKYDEDDKMQRPISQARNPCTHQSITTRSGLGLNQTVIETNPSLTLPPWRYEDRDATKSSTGYCDLQCASPRSLEIRIVRWWYSVRRRGEWTPYELPKMRRRGEERREWPLGTIFRMLTSAGRRNWKSLKEQLKQVQHQW